MGHPCPVCESRDVAEIVDLVIPDPPGVGAKLQAGEWAIGGCVITPDQADYECHACELTFRVDGSVVAAERFR